MMNYPMNKPAAQGPFGVSAAGQQPGVPPTYFPQQTGGQVPPIPAGSTIPGPGAQAAGFPGGPGMGAQAAGFPGTAFPGAGAAVPGAAETAPGAFVPGQLPLEQSYIENILRLNLGKVATIYMTFENNREWNAKIFRGRLEAAGRDHIIISDPQTGMRYLLLMVNLDYITFDEELNYFYPGQITTTGGGR